MNSLFAQLFLAIQEKIKTDVPAIRWIDQDFGQLEDYQVRPPVAFPCVLIDFNQTSYEEMNKRRQMANITFTLRLAFPAFSYAASVAPQSVRELALQYYELEQQLYECIQGFDGGGLMQDCTRSNAATEGRKDDSLRVRVLTFTAMTEDSSAMPKYTKAPRPSLDLIEQVCTAFGVGNMAVEEDLTVG
jgi:hypothetical protein